MTRRQSITVFIEDRELQRRGFDVTVKLCPAEPDVGIPREYVEILGIATLNGEHYECDDDDLHAISREVNDYFKP